MYCSLADLQEQIPTQSLIWLSNDERTAKTMNEPVINSAIRYADELIDAYLRGRYR
ncbi:MULTISPECIES: phage protein Gp36 family protein [Xenorhabdus]|uniref:phage protein Gp36 family protein n=1 Tax=Xenorhabdus TaxID=626 RepID=UPI000A5D0849|nr:MULTISPECIES: phage protein Gp36 family protein [Xenorhabdus]